MYHTLVSIEPSAAHCRPRARKHELALRGSLRQTRVRQAHIGCNRNERFHRRRHGKRELGASGAFGKPWRGAVNRRDRVGGRGAVAGERGEREQRDIGLRSCRRAVRGPQSREARPVVRTALPARRSRVHS